MSDYLALINIGGGSSHGRAPDKEEAIKRCLHFFRDWEDLYVLPEQDLSIQVWDVTGYGHCYWDVHGMHGTNEKTGKEDDLDFKTRAEIVTRHFIPSKKRRKA